MCLPPVGHGSSGAVPDAAAGSRRRLAAAAHQRRLQPQLYDHLRQLQVGSLCIRFRDDVFMSLLCAFVRKFGQPHKALL